MQMEGCVKCCSRFACIFLSLLCRFKHGASAGFYSSTTAEESKYASSVPQWAGFAVSYGFWSNLPCSCICGECHNHPLLIPVQRSQCGVTSTGPSHCRSHLPPPREGPPSLQTLGDTATEIGEQRSKVEGLMSPDTEAPSLGDNQASESKLSSVCTARPRGHRCRPDLCPRNHMFSIYFFSLLRKY